MSAPVATSQGSLPTLVIAGAQKCGTSTLSATVRRHPQVVMSKPKELHFFDRNFDRGLEWYAAHFVRRRRHVHAGEATPSYLYDEVARERMAVTLPDAKVVVILRDPVKRAYSHYWHNVRLGFDDVGFDRAVELEPERLASGARRSRIRFSYLDRGQYVEQLEALATLHPVDQTYVLLLDHLQHDRIDALARLFAFLGVDTSYASRIPEIWTNRYRVKEQGQQRVSAYPPMSAEIRSRLVEHFAPYNDRLATLLDRDFSAWNATAY